MVKKIVAGVDAGSTAVKISLFDGQIMENFIEPVGWNPGEAAYDLLQRSTASWDIGTDDLAYVVGTGYGRVCLDFIDKDVTEITCHARGATHLHPGVRTVIDVGGQDAKAIIISESGRVEEFMMNDKCAAGTGRFLQVMANRLGMDVAKTGNVQLDSADTDCSINSMCTVFAESEVIGLLNKKVSREAIIHALIRSIAERIVAMAAKVRPSPPAVFTGGLSQNELLRLELGQKLGFELFSPKDSLFAGSLGAALIAWDMSIKKSGGVYNG